MDDLSFSPTPNRPSTPRPASPSDNLREQSLTKIQPDRWGSNPARITSFIELPAGKAWSPQTFSYSSPVCGLGWKFDVSRTSQYHTLESNPDVQERRGKFTVTFRSNQCQGMQFRDLVVDIVITFHGNETKPLITKRWLHSSISRDFELGTFEEPFPPHSSRPVLRITIQFSTDDELSFPVTPAPALIHSLTSSLDGNILIDTKFYLFSGRVEKRVGQPLAVYGNAATLRASSSYFEDLLSGSGFQGGVLCNIYEEPPEVLRRLTHEMYDYDSDSDLEDLPQFDDEETCLPTNQPVGSTQQCVETPESNQASIMADSELSKISSSPLSKRNVEVHAYSINGTAHRTWKALVLYIYSNEIVFRPLKSRWGSIGPSELPYTTCSPKSMYRLADYAGFSDLKRLAKAKINEGLSEANIIHELFSCFTSKYDDIIEMEVEFLLQNFTRRVSEEFDNTLKLIVSGDKPHCFRILAFTIKRLHNEDAKTAWKGLKHDDLPSAFRLAFGVRPQRTKSLKKGKARQ